MLITDQNTLNDFCATVQSHDFITIDTEFLREKTYYPKLCLIQIGDKDKNAVAIDVIDTDLDLTPIFELLANADIVKIFHAASQDLEIFYNLTDREINSVFDTQIAAMVCGYGESIGYNNLVRDLTGRELDKSSQFADWSRRPLSEKQLAYALGDVTHLVDVYLALLKELDSKGRTAWIAEESQALNDPQSYVNDPKEMWRKVKMRNPKPKVMAVLRAITTWREIRAQARDMPRSWVLRDDAIMDMVAQIPTTPQQLAKTRNVSEDFANGGLGKQILAAIDEALKSDPSTWPKAEKKPHISPKAQAAIDILKMLLKVQAQDHGVAAKMIAKAGDLEAIALGNIEGCRALEGWRADVFGNDALSVVAGKLAIGLKDGKIMKYNVGD
jgi:ribonuclease D